MAAAISAATQSLATLLGRASMDDHEEVLKSTNTILKKDKNNLEAQHIKVVALLKLDRYDDALRVFTEAGSKLEELAPLEKSYALYKVGKTAEAADFSNRSGGSRGMKHVEAQALYRSENFERTAQIYKDLANQKAEVTNEENDIRINGGATAAQLEWAGQGHLVQSKKPMREDLEAFETAYNAACGSIARGELAQGEVLLKRAKDLCNGLEELSEDEKRAELLPIVVQQIYVYTKQGRVEEAEKLASNISINQIPELPVRRIAQNNSLITSKEASNPYIAHRLFNSTTTLPPTSQPFKFQADLLRRNAYALDLQSMKFDGVATSTAEYLGQNTTLSAASAVPSISVLNAAAHARNDAGKPGLKQILPLLEQRPKDLGLLFTIVQLYMLTNNHGSAIALLESFLKRLDESNVPADQDIRFSPGLVAVIVSLYSIQGQASHIRHELDKAASYWQKMSKPPPSILRAAGTALLESSNKEQLQHASEIFEKLREQDPNDKVALAGFIASHALKSPHAVATEAEKLTSVARLTVGIDAATLEAAGVPVPTHSNVQQASKKRPVEDPAKTVKKRIRKSRLPKDFDTDKKPDPERWLPLRDRAGYRPKGKKGKKGGAGITQGGISKEEEPPANGKSTATPVISGSSSNKKKKGGKKK